MSTYGITTTLPYVNADPHIGHALELVQADMLARWHRALGETVVFNTGTDEHGQKIYQKALEAGQDPQAYCDFYAAKFDGLRVALNLSYTHFIRTTDAKHVAAAQEFWKRCDASGDIYQKIYSVKYCVGCEMEKTDSELVEGRCPLHPNAELERIEEENYFFRWSKYQEPLLKLYESRPDFVVPESRLNEIKSFVAGGLHDFSISRRKEKMPWGIAVPGDESQVMYVWFDALVNYISTLGWPGEVASGQESGASEFQKFWPMVQVAGRDNLRQQTAMWQAMLLSAGIAPSKQIFIHGFITAEGQKMSKSIGNVVNPYDLVAEFGTDATRFYLLAALPPYNDGDFSAAQFTSFYETKLANGLGNLVSRVSAMAQKYFGGELDVVPFDGKEAEARLADAMQRYDFKSYIDTVWAVIDAANFKIDQEAPFKTAKTDLPAARKTLSETAGMIRWIADKLLPVIPTAAEEIVRRYSAATIIHAEPLFPRRETPAIV